jgi:hypothetical protein
MPSISSDFAARLAADFIARGARLFYGHSDFGFPPGHIEIDTRQLDGLRTFYRKVAAENAKIDLCIHSLAKQPVTDAEERSDCCASLPAARFCRPDLDGLTQMSAGACRTLSVRYDYRLSQRRNRESGKPLGRSPRNSAPRRA